MPCLSPHSPRKEAAAFSLLELLVCIVIVATLVVLGLPAYRRARVNADAVVSIKNVRNMQFANIRYSNDHDGWFVPYGALASLKSGDWSDQWIRNKDFVADLGINSFPHGASYYPPGFLSPLATFHRLPDGYGPVQFSYGYNNDIHGVKKSLKPIYHIRASQILRPGKLLAFADSVDWGLSIEHASDYQGEETFLSGSIAYRYGGRAAVAFFDGHAELLDRNAVVGNKLLWLNQ